MKNFKKLVSLGLVVSMMAAMTACGNASEGDDVYKIGGIGPITGAAAVYGQAVKNATQIAVDEINEAGGINGMQVELNFQDDEHNQEKSVNAYNTLKDWGMDLVYGPVTSDPAIAVSSEAANDDYFMLTQSASSPLVIKDKTNVYQVCFTDDNQGMASAKSIGENALATKVAVIYDNSISYSSGIYTKFMEEAANQPFEVVVDAPFTADTATDFSVQLQQAKDAGAELVFLPIYYQEATLILSQAKNIDYNPIFFGCDGLDGILSVENFDTSLAEGVVLLTPFVADATDDKTVAFVQKYQELYEEVPNQFAANAYDGMYILKEAIESAGITPDMPVKEINEKLIAAMQDVSFDGLTGEAMTWEATGEVSKAPKTMVIKDGVYVSYGK